MAANPPEGAQKEFRGRFKGGQDPGKERRVTSTGSRCEILEGLGTLGLPKILDLRSKIKENRTEGTEGLLPGI